MILRTTLLAAVLALGLGSSAMAQGVYIDTPGFSFAFGGPDRYVYGGDAYAYAYAPPVYAAPRMYGYPPSVRGHRTDERIYYRGSRQVFRNEYYDRTGVNNN